ncbi:MAG: hypothetical protein NT003_03125 [Candidatus Magasanikbacteria bacterium]|nr:hypothetical protein [Candidatus Magasanikbacteria bacterium]
MMLIVLAASFSATGCVSSYSLRDSRDGHILSSSETVSTPWSRVTDAQVDPRYVAPVQNYYAPGGSNGYYYPQQQQVMVVDPRRQMQMQPPPGGWYDTSYVPSYSTAFYRR